MLAERQGFEPWVGGAYNGFRDRPVRPLRHLSVWRLYVLQFYTIQILFPSGYQPYG